jgi:hypothetical protein
MHVQEQRSVKGSICSPPVEDHEDAVSEKHGRSDCSRSEAPQSTPLHIASDDISREGSVASDLDAASFASSRALSPVPPPPPLPPATKVTCLQGLAWCLYSQRQFDAEENVLRDLLRHLSEEDIVPSSPAARQKVMVMRRISSCLGSQKKLPEAVDAFRSCITQAQALLPNVRFVAVPCPACAVLVARP